MNLIIQKCRQLRKKIDRASGCSYLYDYFGELVEILELRKEPLTVEENDELKKLIKAYAKDSVYNYYSSANWVRYCARCFYCADSLVKYLTGEEERRSMENYLNSYFHELIDCGVAPKIDKDIFDRYLDTNLTSENYREIYDKVIQKGIRGAERGRYFLVSDVTLALSYYEALDRIIRQYIAKYDDYSMLKVWLPDFGTRRVAGFWYSYPEHYEHRPWREIDRVQTTLDSMLEVHLELMSFWFWHNPQEYIDNMPEEDMIEILEVSDDDEFEKELRHMVTLPYNQKVEGILEHFTDDDEDWIINLSKELLRRYRG